MKITQAQIQMQSSHVYQREQSTEESLKVWFGDEPAASPENHPPADIEQQVHDYSVSLSEAAMRRYMERAAQQADTQSQAATPFNNGEDPRLTAMRLLLEALTGKKIHIPSLDQSAPVSGSATVTPPPASEAPGQAAPPGRAGWGLEYTSHEVNAEHEEMGFQAQGSVRTADGGSMDVTLAMGMSRDFVESRDLQLRAGDAVRLVDPLVINFAGQPPGLTEQKVAFDLDSDGANEQISFVSPGSGFLFLDRNNDNRATDGSELFGPQQGSGFTELAALDSDANGWLDDNDPLFAKLRVWIKDSVGNDYFAALKELNVGALLLDHRETPFSLNDQRNSQLGQVTDSGLFLREDGSAGTLQEIKLAV